MDKTMTRFIAILAALTCAASAQTYRTVTADTNNAIRTNFTLGATQISGSFAISNVTGLQSALDGKLATNGSAAGLTNFPALLLTTNSSEIAFPAALLRTNGDGSGLTNLPNADLGSATGILPLANGGTGATNASGARTALELGTAATNDATAFQPANTNLTALAGGDGSSLTNVTITDASTLTNFPAELLRTNGDGSGLSNVSVDLTTVLPAYSNNSSKVLAVASGETNVEWIAVSNAVTDASALTNFPASILQTNSADASFPAFLLRTNGSAAGLTSFPTLNQNTTGTASNVTGVVAIANGGSGQTTAAAAIEAFLPSYAGNADRILALNSNATALIWTTNAGGGAGLPETPLAISNGGTGATNAQSALINLNVLNTNASSVQLNGTNLSAISPTFSTVIGQAAAVTNGNFGTAIGASAKTHDVSVAVGYNAVTSGKWSVALGNDSRAQNIGSFEMDDFGGVALGEDASALYGLSVALGGGAVVSTNYALQIGVGTNTTLGSIQFYSFGNVNTNEWAALANAGTVGTNLLRAANITNAQAAIFTATTTNAPTNTNAPTPDAWLDIRVGTNDYKLPLWQ